MKNISFLVKKNMCVGCGACVVVCKENCIMMKKFGKSNVPVLDDKKCTNCNLCLKVCPVLSIDEAINENSLLGKIIKIYIGHSKNSEIRHKSSSGGMATSIALFLLEKRYVDGVICTTQSEENFLENKTILAKSSKEIIQAKGSRYSPASPCTKLKDVFNEKGKFVFIGKGCDIKGLEKLKKTFPELKEKIFLSVGLFCDHQPTREATLYLLRKNKISPSGVKKIYYRGEGWPGYLLIILKNGDQKKIPYHIAWSKFLSKSRFVLPYCRICLDGFSELSDISLGDPWALQGSLEGKSESLILTRSKIGEKIIREMASNNFIEIKEVGEDVLINSQKSITSKKKKVFDSLKLVRKIGKFIPFYKKEDLEKNWKLINFVNNLMGFKVLIKKILKKKL
ncbi:Coenzyme F420 hydrogenase/dehydrogenase, beta subunit C-terminal domain [Patescibacteria group bacterium]